MALGCLPGKLAFAVGDADVCGVACVVDISGGGGGGGGTGDVDGAGGGGEGIEAAVELAGAMRFEAKGVLAAAAAGEPGNCTVPPLGGGGGGWRCCETTSGCLGGPLPPAGATVYGTGPRGFGGTAATRFSAQRAGRIIGSDERVTVAGAGGWGAYTS